MKNFHLTKILSMTAVVTGLCMFTVVVNAQTVTTSAITIKNREALVSTLRPDAVYMHTAYISAVVRPADICEDKDVSYGIRFGRGGFWFKTADQLIPSEDGIITYKAKKMTSGATFSYQAFVNDCTGITYGKIRKFTTKIAEASPVVVETPVITPTPATDTKATEKVAKEAAKKAEDIAKQIEKDKKEADKKAAEITKKAESDAKKKAEESAKAAAETQKAVDAAAKKATEDAKKAADAAKKEVKPVVVPNNPKVKIDTTNGSITPAKTALVETVTPEAPVKEKTGFIKWLLKGNSDK